MVNIICRTDLLLQMHIIINRCQDILLGNMLWHQVAYASADSRLQLRLIIAKFCQDILEHRIIY